VILQSYQVTTVHVGDTGTLRSYVVTEQDMVTLRSLTEMAAYVRFWSGSNAPHVVRQATVDPVNSKIKYRLRGDEYSTTGASFEQWVAFNPSADNGAIGRGCFRVSGPVIEREVLA
jgi:hypothetical protein